MVLSMTSRCVCLMLLSPWSVALAVDTKGIQATASDADNANLLQTKVQVGVAIDSESGDGMLSQQKGEETSSVYVAGTPGAEWSKDEMLAVKAKLWYILSLTQMETVALYKSLHGDGFDEGPLKWRGAFANRMGAQWLRLGFHGCFPDASGQGGCDGCLHYEELGKLYVDYFYQSAVPHKGKGTPNFNNGLSVAIELLEEVYTNKSWPEKTPQLAKSLYESGKSRADLWAFAGLNAAEFGVYLNNMVCDDPDFEYATAPYPDSLGTNGYYGRHCTQDFGTSKCKMNLGKGFKFQTGRKDCVPIQMYKKVSDPACPKGFEVATELECRAAGNALGLNPSHVGLHTEGDHVDCTFGTIGSAPESICFKSLNDVYNDGKITWYIDPPMMDPSRACRSDLNVLNETECQEAATYLWLPFEDIKLTTFKGCFLIEHMVHGILTFKVHWGTGDTRPQTEKDFSAIAPGKRNRAVCRMIEEKVGPYMQQTWGGGPSGQMDGDGTLEFFKKEFDFTPRETVAIMGAHTIGRFHGAADIFRYIWVRGGGMLFNNAYYRNLAAYSDWKFRDPDCGHIGDAFGNRPPARWTIVRRGEMDNKGPISWFMERYICKVDCKDSRNFANYCCQDIPEGGHCRPDNGRANGSDPMTADDDIHEGCEHWDAETGNHEMALPSEMGLYFKFKADPEGGAPSGCPGFSDINSHHHKLEVGCPKNDRSLGEDNGMKMYELVEHYADDGNAFLQDFIHAFEKGLRTGYKPGELIDGMQQNEDIVCPTQESVKDPALMFWSCFTVGDYSTHLSEPFLLVSYLDNHILELNETTGQIQLGPFVPKVPKTYQKWFWATTEHGKTLTNGVYKWGVGNWQYDDSTHYLTGAGGFLMRKAKAGEQAKLSFQKDKDISWLLAGWAQMRLTDRAKPPQLPACMTFESIHGKYLTVGWDGGLNANSNTPGASSRFALKSTRGLKVTLQCAGGKYVSADAAGKVTCIKDKVDDQALFVPTTNLDGTFSWQTTHGNYLAANLLGAVSADKNYEKFKKTYNSDGSISLQGVWGKYAVGEWNGEVKADRWWPGSWERFHVHANDDGTVSWKTVWHKWVKAEPDGRLDAHHDGVVGPEQKFQEIDNGDATFSYKTHTGELMVADGKGKMWASRKWDMTAYEHFRPVACDVDV